ncbi:MAG: DUF3887 domain-containing protein [Clostridia bacterium]|nr:DUF3887 domain-containing protein [Clostridia bacterium]
MPARFLIAILFLFITTAISAQTETETINRSIDFLENLKNEDYQANRQYMAPAHADANFENKLRQSWQYQISELGKFVSLESTKYDRFRDYEIVYLTSRFEKKNYTLKLVYNKRSEITDVIFIPYPPLIGAGNLNTLWLIIFLIVWELAWKAMGLWKAAKNQQLTWFLAIFVLPTFGLLPIVYTLFVREKIR